MCWGGRVAGQMEHVDRAEMKVKPANLVDEMNVQPANRVDEVGTGSSRGS